MLSDVRIATSPAPVVALQFRDFDGADDLVLNAESSIDADETELLDAVRMAAEASDRARKECAVEMQRALAEQEELHRTKLAEAVKEFAQAKRKYFDGLEQQVVRLSLGIAEKVLQHEAATDPLSLAGAVRAALGAVAGRSDAILKVPAGSEDAWRQYASSFDQELTVVAGEGLQVGDCLLDTKVGNADLGVRSQLAEIESSLMALLRRSPVTSEVQG